MKCVSDNRRRRHRRHHRRHRRHRRHRQSVADVLQCKIVFFTKMPSFENCATSKIFGEKVPEFLSSPDF